MADGSTAVIGAVEIEILAGNKAFNRNLTEAERRARNAGTVMVREFDRADRSAERLDRTLKSLGNNLGLLGAGFTAGAIAKGVVDAADKMTLLRGRIGQVITESESLTQVWRDLFNAAQNNRASLEGTAQLYLRLRNSVRDLNHEQALGITQTFAQTLVISGASASEAAAATLQFAQAMGSARLQGDELRSILENNSRFARILADSLGVSTGQLKELGEAGALTTEIMAQAMSEQSATVATEFNSIPLTVGQAMTKLSNAVLAYVGETDQAFGFSARLAQGINALTENVAELGDALLVLGAAGVGGVAAAGLLHLAASAHRFSLAMKEVLSDLAAGSNPAYKRFAEQRTLAILNAAKATEEYKLALQTAKYAQDNFNAAVGQGVTGRQLGGFKANVTRTQNYARDAFLNMSRLGDIADEVEHKYNAAATSITSKFQQVATVAGRVGGALLNAFGGPVGIAITAAAVAMGLFVHNAQQAAKQLQDIRQGLDIVSGLQLKIADDASAAAGAIKDANAELKREEEQLKLNKAAAEALAVVRERETRASIAAALAATKAEQARTASLLANTKRVLERGGLRTSLRDGGDTPAARAAQERQKAKVADLEGDLKRLEDQTSIFERALKGIDDGVYQLGETASGAAGPVDAVTAAVERFNKAIALQRQASTNPRFKSSITKNALDELAGIDLESAVKKFPEVRDLLSDQDAVAVQKNFEKIRRASVLTTSEIENALDEFRTAAEEFAKAIDKIQKADPIQGDKSKAALKAIIDYGRELKNIPAAIEAIQKVGAILKPEDAEAARAELRKLAEESYKTYGSPQSQANREYAASIKAIDEAEAALIATGARFDPKDFDFARAIAAQEQRDALKQWNADFEELGNLIREMMTPAEKLKEELADLANLRAGEAEGSLGAAAVDRARIQLLDEEARAAGSAADAIRTLKALQASAGYTDAQVRTLTRGIQDSAAAGRAGMRWGEMSSQQQAEEASYFFATTFTQALTEGIKSGDFGQALYDVIANKTAEAMSDAIFEIGNAIGNWLFGGSGGGGGALDGLFAAFAPRAGGGGVRKGGAYLVGEREPELFVPGSDGRIFNGSHLRGAASAHSGMNPDYMGGVRMGDIYVAGDVGTRELLNQMRQEQEQQARELPGFVRNTVRDMGRRT